MATVEFFERVGHLWKTCELTTDRFFVGQRTSSIDKGQKATPGSRDFRPSGMEINTVCHQFPRDSRRPVYAKSIWKGV